MSILDRYHQHLSQTPVPGYGTGCHTHLLGSANLGVLAGLPPSVIFQDLREAIPPGGRCAPDREILAAINRALADQAEGRFQTPPKPKAIVKDGPRTLQRLISQAEIDNEMDLMESSPIRLLNSTKRDPATFLKAVFEPYDLVFIGERHEPGILGQTIRRRDKWIEYFEAGGKTAPFVVVNPLTGNPAPKKSGDGSTLRGDGCVAAYRHCLVEFDNLSHEDQIRFFAAAHLPVKALIDSGNKSIHAWIDVPKLADIATSADWGAHIKTRLFDAILGPLGADRTCSNAARLARLPGHKREGKGIQRLLWLSPNGRTVNECI